ncbi:MAG: autotransporter outer membrane beta-barrel domain-containing protein [Alphaproteobacteria bacterium]|nr:autotransporter outer membrane beta-barrel domain-containing protein [Alphaproteobacteria bacterium]
MNYTRTALGLLSAQYRSVLKKCFLINLGLFALEAVTATPASADIHDYDGTYTGRAAAPLQNPLYYKWQYDDIFNIYKLVTVAESTEANIMTERTEERVWSDNEIPGFDPETGILANVVYSNIINTATTFPMGQYPDLKEVDAVYVGNNIDNVRGEHDYYPVAAALSNNKTIDKIGGKFIGNTVITSSNIVVGNAYLESAAYGGAIFNSSANIYSAIHFATPDGAGVINEISGDFVGNGVTITAPSGNTPVVYMDWHYDPNWDYGYPPYNGWVDNYRAWFPEGGFGGAIANAYGLINSINNAKFENNYAISTATSDGGVTGDVGGAAIFNVSYIYWWRGHGYQNIASQIGNITADFTENVAYTAYGNVIGGTILNMAGKGTATIGNINGNFSKNSAISQNGDIYGGVIGNMLVDNSAVITIASISGTFDKNTGSATNVYGGVIYNEGEITNGIKNSTFTDNTFTASGEGFGAAIYTDQDLTIAADNGTTLFKGNKINDVANAIYMDNADLTISATNSGTATFYDTIDGENAAVAITGDATGTVQLYNDISNSDVTVEKVTLETTDGTLHDYSLKSLTSNADSKWKIDINTKDKKADTFATDASATTASSGTVTLNEINYVDSAKSDITDDFKVQVLKTQGTTDAADLQLALSDDLTEKFVIDEKEETVVDEVTANTKWSDEFNKKVVTTKTEGQFGLATTDTLNDSIGVTISTDTTEDEEKLGDTLALVNQAKLDDKNFIADTADEVYKAEDDSGTTYGNLTIKGVADGAQKSTIDLNGHNGFVIADGASVTLQDAALTDSQGKSPIDVAAGGKMSLQNADVSNVNLNVDGTLEAANNKVMAKKAVFGKGSTLKLDVNSISGDYGAIKADSFDIADGAKIDITFGQNPLDGKKFGEVALLSLSDGSDINNNNFSDEFHNNMYGFARKSDKSGIYGVYQTKTAREISEENGGSGNNQDAAGAWVDGPSHGNPIAQGIADDLARLAQTNGVEFNKVLTALAPNDDGMGQSALIDLTDRLLLTVDNHLIKSFMNGGLSSGDGYPDLSDVKTWVKTYYAKSKMQNHGDTYGYDADDRGFIAGVDKKIASATKVGIGMQFDDTDVNAFRRDVNIQTLQGYIYGEYRPSNWFINGVLSYGHTDFDEDKRVLGRNISAHYSADIYSVQGLTGYTFKYLTPELGARYYKIKRHAYVDEAMQSVSGNDMDLLRATLGVKAETSYSSFKPHAYAGIMYDVISDKDNAFVSLPNGTSYTVDGKSMPRFGVEIGIGSSVVLTDHLELGVGYEAKFRKHYQDHSGWLDFKYAF